MNRRLLPAGLVLIAMGAFSACAAGYGVYYVPGPPPPPPAYAYGAMGAAPGAGFVWVNGYHAWRGNAWAWTPVAWVRPPRLRAVWVAPSYRPYGGRYRYYAGHWR